MSSRSTLLFALACLGLVTPGVIGQSAPELGRIPPATASALHVRLGKIYAGPAMKDVRDFLDKAGPRAMDTLNRRFPITPFHIDRITAVALLPNPENLNEPPLGVMIATTVEIRAEEFARLMELPGKPDTSSGYPVWQDSGWALAVVEPKLMIVGQSKVVEALAKAKSGAPPEAFADLQKHDLCLLANLKAIPADLSQFLPPPLTALAKATTIRATLDIEAKTQISLTLDYPGEKEAMVAEDAIKDLARQALGELNKPRAEMMRMLEGKERGKLSPYSELPEAMGGLLGLAMLNEAEGLLRNPPIKREKGALSAKLELEAGPPQMALATAAMGTGLLLPAVQKVRAAAQRMESSNNLKQIGLAFHNYESAYGRFPSDILDKKTGKPLLSWRVAFLPYIEQNALYQQFKLDEPWDSEHNIKLAKVVVKIYRHPAGNSPVDSQGNALTHYLAIKGPGAMFETGKKLGFANITDGTSNTIMFVEAKNPVIWTKPADLDFDKDKEIDPTQFGCFFPQGFNATFGDGSVRFISHAIDKVILKALLTRDGGEVIDGNKVP